MEEVYSRQGKIYSVHCVDFVTYDEVYFFPTEYLNIIIGPNGTGKSTLVAAIVLGLGGHPKLLSRTHDLLEYIKRDKTTALIEIQLYSGEEDVVVVSREFSKNGTDVFTVDGKQMSHKAALAKIRKDYNVQIDNLCQFLPQDRVQDFAKMGPQEILKNTQISSCSDETNVQFNQLLELRSKQKNVGTNTEKMRKTMADLVLKNEAIRPQVENVRERTKLVDEIEMCNRKKAWIQVDAIVAKLKEFDDDMKKAKDRLNESKKNLEPRLAEANQIKSIKKALDDRLASESSKKAKASSDLQSYEDRLSVLEREMNKVRSDQVEVVMSAREHAKELEQATIALRALHQDVLNVREKYGNQEQFKVELAALKNSVTQFAERKSKLVQDLDLHAERHRSEIQYKITAIKSRLVNLENVEKKKLELLASKDEHAYQATKWLNDHQHLFQGRVLRPIILELSVIDQKNAKFIESVIPFRDLIAFTFERKEDVKVFIHEVREKLRLKVNTVQSDYADKVMYTPTIPLDHLHEFGFHAYMIDLVTGPPQILNYLCKTYRLHNIPIGSDQTFEMSGRVPTEIRLFFTPNHRFVVNVSRYTGQRSSSTNEIRARKLLDAGVDRALVEQQQRMLADLTRKSDTMKTQMSQIEYQIKTVDDEITAINGQRRKIEDNINAVAVSAEKLKRAEIRVQKLKSSTINVAEEKEKFKQRARQIIRNLIEMHKKIASQLDALVEGNYAYEAMREKIRIHQTQNADIGAQIAALEDDVAKATTLVRTIQNHVDAQKSQHKSKIAEATRICNGQNPNAKNFAFRVQFQKLPPKIEDLEAKMFELNARLQCMVADTAGIQEEYDTRNEKIDELRQEIEDTETNSEKIQADMVEIHAKWLPTIEQIVERINTTFQTFMDSMDFSGEVRLDRKDEFEYSEYGIMIMVKYRNDEKLQALDRFVQSGGERAVAIAIYTLSLQQLSKVPFRCVDEINQGMDPRNERRIFKMLVQETCQPDKSQYFFVTPKLLPNLPFHDLMTVHIVHNGKFVGTPHVFCADQLDFDD